MSKLSFLVFGESDEKREELARRLEATGRVGTLAQGSDLAALPEAVRDLRPAVLVLDLSSDADQVLDRVEKLPAPAPALLVCGPEEASAVILRSMRLGAEAYLTLPLSDHELEVAIDRIVGKARAHVEPSHRAPVVAVFGAKGGVGTTTIACELARHLAHGGARTALVDLDLDGGDVALHFDRDPRFSLADARERRDLDHTFLETLLEKVSDSLNLLCAPSLPEDGERVLPAHLGHALTVLRGGHDLVVLDLPSHLGELTAKALEEADAVLFVTTCDAASLLQARRRLELMKRMGFDLRRVHVLLNRIDKKSPMSSREVRDFLGHAVDCSIHNDYAVLQESQNTGHPPCELAPRSRFEGEFEELAHSLHEWLELPRPDSRVPSGTVGRMRSFLRSRIHGAD